MKYSMRLILLSAIVKCFFNQIRLEKNLNRYLFFILENNVGATTRRFCFQVEGEVLFRRRNVEGSRDRSVQLVFGGGG